MTDPEGNPGGLAASFRRIVNSTLGLLHIRLQLFSMEVEAEKLRLMDTILKLTIAMAVAGVGLALGALTLAIYVWEIARYRGLVAMTIILIGAGCFLIWRVRKEFHVSRPPFSKSLAEFEKDRACLQDKD